jgi:polysaccharide export outer membrane protein
MHFLVRLLLLVFLSSLAGSLVAQAPNGSGGDPLRLRPGDAVRLEVRDEPDLLGDYVVDAEGKALLPLIGLVSVAGRSFEEVRRDVLASFGRELADPAGRVRITPVLRIAVLGEVVQPGLVPVDPTFTLADVVASAGGLSPSADRGAISLVRDGQAVLTTSMEELPLVRATIQSGDRIVVGRRSWMQENLSILVGGGVSVFAALLTALILR